MSEPEKPRRGRPPNIRSAQSAMSAQEQAFVKNYVVTGSYVQAAQAAGLSLKQARAKGHQMAKRPPVAAAIKNVQETVAKETAYDLKEASRLIDEDLARARAAKQFTAVANMHQLKAKMHGLIIDRSDATLRLPQLSINIGGIDERPAIEISQSLPALINGKSEDESLFD